MIAAPLIRRANKSSEDDEHDEFQDDDHDSDYDEECEEEDYSLVDTYYVEFDDQDSSSLGADFSSAHYNAVAEASSTFFSNMSLYEISDITSVLIDQAGASINTLTSHLELNQT